jgi:hypothetical protein
VVRVSPDRKFTLKGQGFVVQDRLDQINWDITLHVVIDNGEPMSWNLFLAFVPLAFSSVLFYRPQSPIARWGIWLLLGRQPEVIPGFKLWRRVSIEAKSVGWTGGDRRVESVSRRCLLLSG